MKKEIKRLHALGFGIHLLHPKSKRPIESRWTTGPRKKLKELLPLYKEGMNIGVRLGRASKFQDGYLAVIDCDVKSGEREDALAMEKKLLELFPTLKALGPAFVLSGRGNGSKHIYAFTKEPVQPKSLYKSEERVKVHMPSVAPSGNDRKFLSPKEIEKGYRSRPAWEISLMGEGQQVVLPPSIHPDSGKPYKWGKLLMNTGDLLHIEGAAVGAKKEAEVDAKGFEAVDVDLTRLSEKTRGQIKEGEGVEDRSGALLGAAIAMVRQDYSDNEILSVLTDKENYLGQAAFDHAQTNSRKRAARWIAKYTLKKARVEGDEWNNYDNDVVVEDLPEKEAVALHKKVTTATHWTLRLERTSAKDGAKIKTSFKNVKMILENAVGLDVFRHNEFFGSDFYGRNTPWGGRKGEELKDIDLINLKSWLVDDYRFEPQRVLIDEVVQVMAYANKFHPVKEYLNKLEWDGVPRVDTWLKRYLNAKAPEPYLSAISRKVLVAMVARIYNPGMKYDQVLILQGNQGYGKSTVLRNLVGDEWFSDATLNVNDKDSILAMRNIWLRELGELSGMRKADSEALKEFISRTTDRIRVPYGKRTESFPRQCIFIATTNKDEFLKDETGNRRFWPVNVGRCDFDAIKEVRDQLFAEACYLHDMGEPLYLEDKRAEQIAIQEQSLRMESDILTETVQNFVESELKKPEKERFNLDRFTLAAAFAAGMFDTTSEEKMGQMRAANTLRALGFKKHNGRIKGRFCKFWGR